MGMCMKWMDLCFRHYVIIPNFAEATKKGNKFHDYKSQWNKNGKYFQNLWIKGILKELLIIGRNEFILINTLS